MLRFLFLIFLAYLFYRLLIWFRDLPKKMLGQNRKGTGPRPFPKSGAASPGKVIDEMKACPQCGTYNPLKSAYKKKGLYFCNQRCHEAYLKSHTGTQE